MSIINDKENGSKGSNMPAEDLEQYGVWVKAGPETVKEDSPAKDDFELADVSDASTEITEEEEALLGSLEENSRQKESPEEDLLNDMDDFSFDEPSSDEPAAKNDDDDFSFPDIEDIRTGGEASGEAGAEGDETASADEDFFLPEEESLDAGISAEDEGGKIELDFDLDEPQEDAQAGADEFNDIAAVEKEMTDEAPGPAIEKDMVAEEENTIEENVESGENEIEITEEETEVPAGEAAAAEASEAPATEEIVNEDFGLPAAEDIAREDFGLPAEEEITREDFGPPAAEDTAAEESEAPATEKAIEEAITEEKPGAAAARIQPAEASILSKIEEELASIKSELSELKKELAGLRVAGSAEGAAEHHKVSGAESGFFADDEDEDETIALTGDELDNILSTADITEETGESDVPDDILNFNADIHLSAQEERPEAEVSGDVDLDFMTPSDDKDVSVEAPEAEAAGEIPAGGADDISPEDMSPEDTEIFIEEPEPDAAVPGKELELGDIPEAGQEIDMTDSRTEALSDSFEKAAPIVSSDDTPAVTESIPLTTPEEQAIIEEYNRELDKFGSEDLPAEEGISETLAGEAEIPADEEESEIEFDLDSLRQEAGEEPAESEEAAPEAFEESLPEIEIPADEVSAPEAEAGKEAPPAETAVDGVHISGPIREEIRSVLKYMDQLLESLPEDKIQEFARSEHFDIYRKLFEELELE
jgi:hypothetical protein